MANNRYLLLHVEYLRRRVQQWRALYMQLLWIDDVHLHPGTSPDRKEIMREYKSLLELSKDFWDDPDVRIAIQELSSCVSSYEYERAMVQEPNESDL